MNRLLEMKKELTLVRKKPRRKGRLVSTATAIRERIRPRFSHEMAIFKETGLDDGNVWLEVMDESDPTATKKKTFSISRFTRVKNVTAKGGREHFTIVDWPYEGVKASVVAPAKGSRFKTVSYEDEGGVVTYSISKKQLSFGSSSKAIKTFMSDPLPKASYNLLLPDAPHAGGNNYTSLTPHATVWFKIEQTHDKLNRYLHVGKATAGCVTCGEVDSGGGTDDDRKRWSEVYNYLINRRPKKSTKYVGVLKVVS